jgi:hypothetical protein
VTLHDPISTGEPAGELAGNITPPAHDIFTQLQQMLGNSILTSHAPAGLSREEAAHYIGVSPSSFDDLVRKDLMPQPLPLEIRRNVWHIKTLDSALDRLSEMGNEQQVANSNNQLLQRVRNG